MAKELENKKGKAGSQDEDMNFRNLVQDEDVVAIEDDGEELVLDVEAGAAVETSSAHDDFDWTRGKKNATQYTDEEKAKMLAEFDKTLNTVNEFEVVQGTVISIGSHDILLDMQYKSDGLVPKNDFRDRPELKAGDKVEVYLETIEDANGQLVLSRRKAKLLLAWENIVRSFEQGTIISGLVVNKTKGGLIVDVDGLETFLPGSQIDIKPIVDYDIYVGKQMEFKVVKINEAIKNAVISHKVLIEKDLEEQRVEILKNLDKGQVLEGTVKNITDFGAFLDLGGIDGLLYITDISWGRIKHPSDVLSLNQKINVVVLDFDDEKSRISLGLKQLEPHPWETLAADVTEGSIVKGNVVNVEDYGAFLEIQPGVEGLVHVSEISWSNQPVSAREYFKLGSSYGAKVVTLDREERKMSLSLKQMSNDPWTEIAEKFPKDSRHTGVVKNITPYGVFVELSDGIGGMVHISDLSWTKRYGHPTEFVKQGEQIDVVVLDVDVDNRKLSLGHKQVEDNPWDTFESVFPVGSYHEATVIRKDDRGAVVSLPYGLEAYSPIRHIRKENGSNAEVDDVLMFKVIEFNRDDKRILVSHSRYLEDIRKEAEHAEETVKTKERDETVKAVKKTQEKVEKSSLGEIEGFAALRDQFKDEA